MRCAALLLSFLFLTACSTQPISLGKQEQYKRVGILSAMGDRFSTNAVGVMVFGNEQKSQELELGLDDILTQQAQQILSKQYDVVDLTKYRTDFLRTEKYWPGQQGAFAPDRPMTQDVVRNLMGAEHLDAYIILTPASASVRGTNQGVGGIGIVKLQRPIGADEFLLHTAYIVSVIDGKDYSFSGDMRAIPIDETSFTSFGFAASRLSSPNWPVLPQLWQSPENHKTEIVDAFKLLIQQSLPHTFRRAQLLKPD